MKTTSFDEYLEHKLEDSEFRKEYESMEPEYALIEQILELREQLGLTQEELAKRIGTRQCNISRFENGNSNPSLAFLKKIAAGLGKKITITLN